MKGIVWNIWTLIMFVIVLLVLLIGIAVFIWPYIVSNTGVLSSLMG